MTQYGCLVVGFRRPVELKKVISAVAAENFDQVFISVDGADNLSKEIVRQNQSVQLFVSDFLHQHHLDWKLIFQTSRLGIIKNFIASIDLAFKSVDFLCILEDDCVPATGLLSYCKYLDELDLPKDVKMFTFFRPNLPILNTGHFITHNPLMWGWGIRKQEWQLIRNGITQQTGELHFAKKYSVLLQSFYFSGFVSASEGKSDALDALIAYFLLVNNYLVVGPPKNLISNIGYGVDATNTFIEKQFMNSATYGWDVSLESSSLEVGNYRQIFLNDFFIARKMNDWKFHHIFSNVLKIKILKMMKSSSS